MNAATKIASITEIVQMAETVTMAFVKLDLHASGPQIAVRKWNASTINV